VPDIVLLLSREVVTLLAIALVLAFPVAYLAMTRWLEDFAYHVAVGPALFAAAALSALLIALLTVSYHSVRAALADPVKTLRYE
jgi:putative ABC transport system permease protein